MSYQDRNNGTFPGPFVTNQNGRAGSINAPGLAHQITAQLNTDATPSQVIRAIKKYNDMITPAVYTLKKVFTATGEIASLTQNFDSAYGFFGYAWSCVRQGTDVDFVVNSLQITQQTSIIIHDYPVNALSALTAQYAPLFWYVPANSTVTLNLTNGSTTAANTCYFTFYGTRVPTGFINQLGIK